MWKNGKLKIRAFSLVEIMISMAIFSFIFSIVTGIALVLVHAQVRVQSQVFLAQTAQTTLENISRNLRYGYAYLGEAREQ
jgi:type II secretory pathway pseudopilin PulG